MAYQLEALGPHEFEHLVQALLLKLYGPTVGVFGPGADSGRDATFEGRTQPGSNGDAPWDGYHVFQAKFHDRLGRADADLQWLLTQIKRELRKWTDPAKGRKGPKPEYLVFVTNVSLGGSVDGGLDRARDAIRAAARDDGRWPLKDCDVWDRTKIEALLAGHADVRQSFNGLITPGDVMAAANLSHMTDLGGRLESIRTLLEEHARTELVTRGQVSMGEAGDVANDKVGLADVAVDLPARFRAGPHPEPETFPALAHIVTAGESVLRPSVAGVDVRPHFLVMGGPGQGKTTLGRLLAQIYRSALLADNGGLSQSVRLAATKTLQRAQQIGVPRPNSRRWPVRVDLAEYADLAGGGADLPLLRYIADRISASTAETFHPRDLRAWLRAWPWLIVLDGYDEVAASPARGIVAAAVQAFLEQAHTQDADLLAVATTRPQGYSDELPGSFRQLELLSLSAEQAIDYASRLTEVRLGSDADKPAVLQRIADATGNDLTRRLMRTPLQVMIMSLLLERRSKPPQDRAALFSDYYDVIYNREVQKKNYLAEVLAERRLDVDAIHHELGLRLQIASESVGESEALMSRQDFESLIRARLAGQGHEGPGLDKLAGDLLRAAQDRLVLVTAKGKDQVGFELRSIQEFMAAQALVNGPDPDVIGRLRVIAPSAHWRNTWLLSVGALHRRRTYLFDQVLHMIRELDAGDPLSLVIETAPHLAIDVLEDGMAASSPKHLRLLTDLALQLLNGPNLGAGRLGDVLAEIGDEETIRPRVITALQRAGTGSPGERAAAGIVLDRITRGGRRGSLASRARQMRDTKGETQAPATGAHTPGSTVRLTDALPAEVQAWSDDSTEARFLEELRSVKTTVASSGRFEIPLEITPHHATADLLADDQALLRVADAIDKIDPQNWSARTSIVAFLWRSRERTPVSESLSV